MRIVRLQRFLLIALILVFGETVSAQHRNSKYVAYINKYKELAIEQMNDYRIPASITLAAIDADRRCPVLSTITGGMSGPAVKPVALRMVWQVAKAVKIPVIGLGGIMNWRDAVEFMLAGATAIQIGTANFVDPAVTTKVVDGIDKYLEKYGFSSVKEIIGNLKV